MGMATWEEPEARKPHKGCVICPECDAEFSKSTKEWRMGYMVDKGTTPGEFHFVKTVKRGDCPMCDAHVFDGERE
jgi:hypothetical protein